jgi:hypothetical protein
MTEHSKKRRGHHHFKSSWRRLQSHRDSTPVFVLFWSKVMFIKIHYNRITHKVTEIASKKIPAVAIILFTIMGLVLTYTTAGLVAFQNENTRINRQLHSSGNIAAINVGIYSDLDCAQTLESIEWGDVAPGEEVNRIIYLKNTGSKDITLSMTANNWSPANANGPLTLMWDKEGETLIPGEITKATLTLKVSEDIAGITNFSVAISIIGSV